MEGESVQPTRGFFRRRRAKRSTLGRIGRVFGRSLSRSILPRASQRRPGAPAGIEHAQLKNMPPAGAVNASCLDYSPEQMDAFALSNAEELLESERPAWAKVRWINVDGLSDTRMIHALARKHHLHPLALEDVLHVPQRPKMEAFDDEHGHAPCIFVLVRMMQLIEGRVHGEQISMFLVANTVITLQEDPGDVWNPIRQRLATAGTRLRANDASFLVYALLDAIVDHCTPILDELCDRLEALERALEERPRPDIMNDIQGIKHELMLLRREVGPIRDVVMDMRRERHACISDTTRMYLRDVQDHVAQTIDLLETYREFAQALAETYNAAVAIRANEVMRLLTIIATIFIPVTFFTGVFGMNFALPLQESPWAFTIVCGLCGGVILGMLIYFRRRGWL